jgi:hypothetical protein
MQLSPRHQDNSQGASLNDQSDLIIQLQNTIANLVVERNNLENVKDLNFEFESKIKGAAVQEKVLQENIVELQSDLRDMIRNYDDLKVTFNSSKVDAASEKSQLQDRIHILESKLNDMMIQNNEISRYSSDQIESLSNENRILQDMLNELEYNKNQTTSNKSAIIGKEKVIVDYAVFIHYLCV